MRLALTLGDIAGIGPEVVAKTLESSQRSELAESHELVVYGSREILERAFEACSCHSILPTTTSSVSALGPPVPGRIACLDLGPSGLADVPLGEDYPLAGQAAYEFLRAATLDALAGDVDAIVTAPLSKRSLNLAGLQFPGHTEILAELCGADDHAMMLYLPRSESVQSPAGLGVAHVTLHTSIASVPGLLTLENVAVTTKLLDRFMRRIGCDQPRIAVCALNPHGGEKGLFGEEELNIIEPAVQKIAASSPSLNITGPLPSDTLIRRAIHGEFDGIVAMYHDQGHIPFKLIGMNRAVNVTLGLPIVRTSPSHGTAFDIAGRGQASNSGFVAAIDVAIKLAESR